MSLSLQRKYLPTNFLASYTFEVSVEYCYIATECPVPPRCEPTRKFTPLTAVTSLSWSILWSASPPCSFCFLLLPHHAHQCMLSTSYRTVSTYANCIPLMEDTSQTLQRTLVQFLSWMCDQSVPTWYASCWTCSCKEPTAVGASASCRKRESFGFQPKLTWLVVKLEA
jgi:hypothetical protein